MCSRKPAKVASARPNPTAFAAAKITDSINPNPSVPTAKTATPSTAQFVVINGKKIPSA